jgi:RNAse (barnase) inhibitor barstar
MKLRLLITYFGIILVLGLTVIFSIFSQSAIAAPRPSFEFTCETSESDFYDWIETEFWPKGSVATFGRNLDAAFDVLTSTNKNTWEISLPTSECSSDVILESRREAIYLMLEDAAREGFGKILRQIP